MRFRSLLPHRVTVRTRHHRRFRCVTTDFMREVTLAAACGVAAVIQAVGFVVETVAPALSVTC